MDQDDDFPTEEFDAIILGTGLKECIISGLLSKNGKKVLQMDRNDYYGAESASLNLDQIKKTIGDETDSKVDDAAVGRSRDYCIDMCPKFIIGCGDLVKMLIHTGVTRYLEFKHVGGSYVFHTKKLYEVPVTPKTALMSGLLSMSARIRAPMFFKWVAAVDVNDPKTWDKCDLRKQTMGEIYKYWKLDENTRSFTGHAIALYTNDDYMNDVNETVPCIKRIQLYAFSLARYQESPYIYPLYGLGGLPEGFSRLSAVFGGVFMLRYNVAEVLYGGNGKVTGVKTDKGKVAKLKEGGVVVSDPSYFMNTMGSPKPKIRATGRVARWICILNHPVAGTSGKSSAQIILPYNQCKRKSDIYISVMGAGLAVAPKTPPNMYIATISSMVYTDDPKAELMMAYDVIAPCVKEFFFVRDTYQAANNPQEDSVFITSSMDATTHFQSASMEVQLIYKMITGSEVDLTAKPEDVNKED